MSCGAVQCRINRNSNQSTMDAANWIILQFRSTGFGTDTAISTLDLLHRSPMTTSSYMGTNEIRRPCVLMGIGLSFHNPHRKNCRRSWNCSIILPVPRPHEVTQRVSCAWPCVLWTRTHCTTPYVYCSVPGICVRSFYLFFVCVPLFYTGLLVQSLTTFIIVCFVWRFTMCYTPLSSFSMRLAMESMMCKADHDCIVHCKMRYLMTSFYINLLH